MNILAHIGRATLAMLAEIGRVSLFLKDALLQGLTPKIFVRQILEQMMRIGYFSLPVVGLTAFFTGGALALQRPGRDGRRAPRPDRRRMRGAAGRFRHRGRFPGRRRPRQRW